jgi:peroxiredoxin
MNPTRISAGGPVPSINVHDLNGHAIDISTPGDGAEWRMIVIYRGRHCPLCTKYLNRLEGYLGRLADIGVDVVAVSGDSRSQLEDHLERLDVSFPLYHGLTVEQMEALGLYISVPRSEQETDHPFAEPGLIVANSEGNAHVVDISNNPFVRPELEALVSGLEWTKNPDNNYPIRGTYR